MTDLALSKVVTLIADMPPIIAVRLPDGELSATLRSLCELLDISREGQIQRIHRSSSLAEALQEAMISTPGGPQEVEVLLNWAIPIWATGLHIARLSEKKQALALILQRKAFAAIEQAFTQHKDDTAFQPPPGQSATPSSLRQSWHALIDRTAVEFEEMQRLNQADLQELHNQLTVVQYDQRSHELRLAALEARDTSPSLDVSPEHLKHIFQIGRQLRQRRGLAVVDILAMLAEHFRVEDVSLLPESAWPAVLDWFASLLEE